MAEDKKPEKEAPAARAPKSTSDKILEKQKEVAQKQLDRQQIQIKLQEGQKKVDEAMNRGQTTLANSLSLAINRKISLLTTYIASYCCKTAVIESIATLLALNFLIA